MPGFSPATQTGNAMSYLLGEGNSPTPVAPTPDNGQIPFADAAKSAPVPSSSIINTSTQSRTQTNAASSALDAALARLGATQTPNSSSTSANDSNTTDGVPNNDPILSGLNTLQSNSDAATKSLIASTKATYQNKLNDVDRQYSNYKAGLQQMGIETNEAQSSPDLLAGHIQQASNDQMDKINALDAEESKALMDAQNAKADGDFKTLQAKMDYVKQVKQEKQQAIKDMYDNITTAKTASDDEAQNIYAVMQTLDPSDQEAYIQAVAQKYGLPLDSLVGSLASYSATQKKNDLETENVESEIANRGNSASSGGGTDGGYKYSGDDVAQGTSLLNQGGKGPNGVNFNGRGSDGFVDPNAYTAVYNSWIKNNGTPDGFLKKFPVTNVNPDSYDLLPEALQPSSSSTNTP